MATSYESARETNPVDFLVSGVFAAHFVNTVSPTFLEEIVEGRHAFVEEPLRRELSNKWYAHCAAGILNAPDPGFNPTRDETLAATYGPDSHQRAKSQNKKALQKRLGLIEDNRAPLFFWPSRLAPVQKGCQLLADVLYRMVSTYWNQNLQIVFVASGEYQDHFRNIVAFHGFQRRVAICDFDVNMEHLAYGASDFVLMPSLFEPCGLPQMIGSIYGALPVAHDTGGLHDTIFPLNVDQNRGNGFLFENFDGTGLFWAIERAMDFFNLPAGVKDAQISRIMKESLSTFNHSVTARNYIGLYEKMLQQPLIK
jgi:starch synthase/alpha-amylase